MDTIERLNLLKFLAEKILPQEVVAVATEWEKFVENDLPVKLKKFLEKLPQLGLSFDDNGDIFLRKGFNLSFKKSTGQLFLKDNELKGTETPKIMLNEQSEVPSKPVVENKKPRYALRRNRVLNGGKSWSDKDLALGAALINADRNYKEIAVQLNRSEKAVRNQHAKGKFPNAKPYNPSEMGTLRAQLGNLAKQRKRESQLNGS